MSGAGGGGLDPGTIKPPDAVAALRSFPRRWRSALGVVADDPAADELVARPAGDGPSALSHAWNTAESLQHCHDAVRIVRSNDHPTLNAAGVGGSQGSLESALAQIDTSAPALAATLDDFHGDDWLRTGVLDGAEVTILALVQHTVAGASDHLRAAEQALRTARQRPTT